MKVPLIALNSSKHRASDLTPSVAPTLIEKHKFRHLGKLMMLVVVVD